jgi:hypothetical protein
MHWDVDGMRIDRRLTFIGVMLVVLSMTMATQYATTKVSYTFGVVHPSNADIRFIGSDNSSSDGHRVLRVNTNTSGNRVIIISLGDWMPNSVKNYTAAFCVVNEEGFKVNITHINVSGTGSTYISVYLHGNRSTDAASEAGAQSKVLSVLNGVSSHNGANSNAEWILGAGDGDPATANGTGANSIQTPWDETSHIRYNSSSAIYAKNNTRDFVWVQISLNIPSNAADATTTPATGQIWIHFKANTHT